MRINSVGSLHMSFLASDLLADDVLQAVLLIALPPPHAEELAGKAEVHQASEASPSIRTRMAQPRSGKR